MPNESGLVYVFTGEGKGKTSAAIGTAVRAISVGMKVAWVAWYKQASWKISEIEAMKKMGIEIYLLGKGFHIGKSTVRRLDGSRIKTANIVGGAKVIDSASELEHKAAAQAAYIKADELLNQVDLLVLDEVCNAVDDGLIDEMDLMELIWHNEKYLVITGRNATKLVIENADLVTEMKKIKHPYDKGKLAVRGLDF